MINLANYSQHDLEKFFTDSGEKSFHAVQVIKWIHHEGITDFNAMTNLNLALREKLRDCAVIEFPSIVSEQGSKDGTYKWLFRLHDNNHIETVLIPEKNRGTLCISSQVGCSLACGFCATATIGLKRNLQLGEIIGQLWMVTKRFSKEGFGTPRIITNVVLMGMGEPLLNFDNVVSAMDIMMSDNGYGLSKYRVTLSTAGIIPAMLKLREVSEASLAVSLHAPNDELRNKLMPINRKYPLNELMKVCKNYYKDSRRAVTFEYVMIDKVNDGEQHAHQLVKLVQGIRCKINLIPFNPFPGSKFRCSNIEAIERFRNILLKAGINTITRKTRGSDIKASCGQLIASASE
jgi:23S rRNA (adenine2503-C2)-methyltransferase